LRLLVAPRRCQKIGKYPNSRGLVPPLLQPYITRLSWYAMCLARLSHAKRLDCSPVEACWRCGGAGSRHGLFEGGEYKTPTVILGYPMSPIGPTAHTKRPAGGIFIQFWRSSSSFGGLHASVQRHLPPGRSRDPNPLHMYPKQGDRGFRSSAASNCMRAPDISSW
jgi:hypothetical protein